MSFKMDCPHCKRTLNVTEKAFGKTVPCPGCNQPVTVPQHWAPPPPPRRAEMAAPFLPAGAARPPEATLVGEPESDQDFFASSTPVGSPQRQPSYAMQAGRMVGKLNKRVLWLAGIGGILALVLVAVVLLPQIPGFAEARFDLRNLETTKRWALQQYLAQERIRGQSNAMQEAQATKELERLLQETEGKVVHWRIAVGGVTRDSVFLQSAYSELVPGGPAGKHDAVYMVIGCEEDIGPGATLEADSMGAIAFGTPFTIKGIPCRLTTVEIGNHIAPALATKLKNGDYVSVQATIGKTGISYGSILIRLDKVAVSE